MKDLIISHVKDVDGVTPVILMNLWNKNYDCKLLDVHEMFDDDPHVLIFQAPCFESSILDFSKGYALIDHAYEYGKQRILELKQKGYLLS